MKALTVAAIMVCFLWSPLSGVALGAYSWDPDDGCATGTSTDGYFYAAGPAAYWQIDSGGWNNCHMETATQTGQVTNYAEWFLPISTDYDGTYSDQAYVSSAGPGPYTSQAIYYMWANGHSGDVTQTQVLDQSANQGGYCYIFGPNTTMNGSNGGFAEIIDQNNYADGMIYVDLFCFAAQ